MENTKIIYAPVESQIEKLKQQGLVISDESAAKDALLQYGYTNLIKGYREPYTLKGEGTLSYQSGVTFEQILSLYSLDNRLRSAVMSSMLDLEEHIKEAAADVIAIAFGVHQDEYLKFSNYRDKKKGKPQFTLSGILDKMRKTLETDKNPISYYSQKYDVVPPWILFKSVYFGTIVNFIHLFKPDQQVCMASKLYGPNFSEAHVSLMIDTLFVCAEYRNLAAHGGRTYSHHCKRKVLLPNSKELGLRGFSKLFFLLQQLRYQKPYENLEYELNTQINRHCNMFPKDTTYLAKILNVNIDEKSVVWLTGKDRDYHMERHCNGCVNPRSIELTTAEEEGYVPCVKCCK